jgi:nucleoside-diphosphate-sugar epimerase
VGGWIVEHLILRGENPRAIRIADLAPPRREHAVKEHVTHINADIRELSSVENVFSQPWPPEVADLPLTVFHTAAYIHAGHRSANSLPPFLRINIEGTQNVLKAAKAAGCDIFIATSSASIALKNQTFFSVPPWRRYPDGFIQLHDNAEAEDYDAPLNNFAGSYAYSKARADKLVRDADDKTHRFRTGTIRPGHSIYGHGDENPNSLATNYLMRGGLAT